MISIEDLPEPFLGRLVIETIKEDSEALIKARIASETKGTVSTEFLNRITLVTTEEQTDMDTGRTKHVIAKKRVPISKGRILKKAPDAFGDYFKSRYGDVGYTPDIGDVVLFIPNESSRLEPTDTYHFLNDCDIQGYHKATKTKEVTETKDTKKDTKEVV